MKRTKYCDPPLGVILAVFLFVVLVFSMLGCSKVEAATHTRTFRATAYCGCRKCNGKWTGQPTASGTDYVEGRTVAVYKPQIKLGTHIWVNGKEYVAEDTGKHINWDCVDIYFNNHQEASDFGIKYVTVEWED